MPESWNALIPRIAPRLVGAVWTRSALEELLTPYERSVDIYALAVRLLDALPVPPYRDDVARRVLTDLEFPGEPYVPPIVVTPPPPKSFAWRFDVPRIASVADLAAALNVTVSELDWFADLGGWLRRTPPQPATRRPTTPHPATPRPGHPSTPLRHYRAVEVPKRHGVRILEVPKPRLREMKRTVVRRILDRIPPHDAAHGFRRGHSAVTFARPHERADVVVRIDLADFFPSITRARVTAVFAAWGYAPAVAGLLAGICTTAMPVDESARLPVESAMLLRTPHLPQGAPTSPALANLVARGLDRRVAGYARSRGVVYTRYADDLALSGHASVDVARMIAVIGHIARDEGFAVNHDKTLIRRSHRRQCLAGLVVNESAAVPRETYDALRALLHNCARTGASSQNREGRENFREYVFGLIAWVGESSASRRRQLWALAAAVDWDT